MNSGPVWTEILARSTRWVVTALAVGGSGYLAGGRADEFSRRAQEAVDSYPNVDYVIFAGGINDVDKYPASKIANAARQDIETVQEGIDAQVIVLSPFASGRPTTDLVELSDAMTAVARDTGVPYVDALRMLSADQIGSDGVHPTDLGHQALARQLEDELSRIVGASR